MPDSPLSQAALVTSALPLLGIGYNVFQGDTDVSISPMLGVNVDPATGSFMPSIAANVQVKRINGFLLLTPAPLHTIQRSGGAPGSSGSL